MKSKTPEVILRAAHLVRDQIEELVPRLDRWSFEAGTLMGACGIASYVLHRVLKRLAVKSDMLMGVYVRDDYDLKREYPNHCWVVYQDLIIDVTATQFRIPARVHVTKDAYPYLEMFRNEDALEQFTNWDEQDPRIHERHLRRIEDAVVRQVRRTGA